MNQKAGKEVTGLLTLSNGKLIAASLSLRGKRLAVSVSGYVSYKKLTEIFRGRIDDGQQRLSVNLLQDGGILTVQETLILQGTDVDKRDESVRAVRTSCEVFAALEEDDG